MSIPERQKDTCPFCGSEETEEDGMFFKCGTYSNTVTLEENRSELCKERELRQKAEAVINDAYVCNQNMHCYQTKGKLNDELNRQTVILRNAIKPNNQ